MKTSVFKAVLVVFLVLSFVTAPKILAKPIPDNALGGAGGNWAEMGPAIFNQKADTQIQSGVPALESYSGVAMMNSITNGLTRLITGSKTQTLRTAADAGDTIASIESPGAIGTMAFMIGGMYQYKPASSVDYIAHVAKNAGFDVIKPAYAAEGIGFTALTPVLKIWELMRNIAYMTFAVLFVVIGLMIILRVKIDPKTVMTIQNSLPKIIFSLVLITFSYPIAGFMIDLMYVFIGVIMGIARIGGILSPEALKHFSDNLATESIFGFIGMGNWWGITTGSAAAIKDVVDSLAGPLSLGGLTGGIIGALGGLIVALAILYALVKTWLMLLGSYINILIGVIFSPLAMLGEAIPGIGGLGTWLRAMISNLAAFPLVVVLIVFGKSIMEYGNNNSSMGQAGGGFVPPLIGGNNPAAITSLIGKMIVQNFTN